MPAILQPSRRIIRPDEKPPFEFTQRYGLDWRNSPVSLEGLLGCWILNAGAGNTAHDLSRNGYNGTFAGTVAWGTDKYGHSLYYSADGSYVDCGDVGGITDKMTVVAGINLTDATVETRGIVAKWRNVVGKKDFLFWFQSDGDLAFNAAGVTSGVFTSYIPNEVNKFHQVVGRYDGTAVELFVDALSYGSNVASGNIDNSAESLEIGRYNDSDIYSFMGHISYVYLYKRALSNFEIWQLNINPFCTLARPYPYIIGGKSAAAPSSIAVLRRRMEAA